MMDLEYVFGPVVATDTLLNANVQFHRVFDRQEKTRGWAWTTDEPLGEGEFTGGLYDVDVFRVIDDLAEAVKQELRDAVEQWYDDHPKAAQSELEGAR